MSGNAKKSALRWKIKYDEANRRLRQVKTIFTRVLEAATGKSGLVGIVDEGLDSFISGRDSAISENVSLHQTLEGLLPLQETVATQAAKIERLSSVLDEAREHIKVLTHEKEEAIWLTEAWRGMALLVSRVIDDFRLGLHEGEEGLRVWKGSDPLPNALHYAQKHNPDIAITLNLLQVGATEAMTFTADTASGSTKAVQCQRERRELRYNHEVLKGARAWSFSDDVALMRRDVITAADRVIETPTIFIMETHKEQKNAEVTEAAYALAQSRVDNLIDYSDSLKADNEALGERAKVALSLEGIISKIDSRARVLAREALKSIASHRPFSSSTIANMAIWFTNYSIIAAPYSKLSDKYREAFIAATAPPERAPRKLVHVMDAVEAIAPTKPETPPVGCLDIEETPAAPSHANGMLGRIAGGAGSGLISDDVIDAFGQQAADKVAALDLGAQMESLLPDSDDKNQSAPAQDDGIKVAGEIVDQETYMIVDVPGWPKEIIAQLVAPDLLGTFKPEAVMLRNDTEVLLFAMLTPDDVPVLGLKIMDLPLNKGLTTQVWKRYLFAEMDETLVLSLTSSVKTIKEVFSDAKQLWMGDFHAGEVKGLVSIRMDQIPADNHPIDQSILSLTAPGAPAEA